MGPTADALGGRPRKDIGHTMPPENSSQTPLSFRLAKEEDIRSTFSRGSDSNYGIQSLENTFHEATTRADDPNQANDERRRSTLKPKSQGASRDASQASIDPVHTEMAESSPSRPYQYPPSMSHSIASISLDSQAPLSSLSSSPKSISNPSFGQSDEGSIDESGSQAIASSEDEDVESRSKVADTASNLIMPSIKMPSRRPFTDRGKAMGRLKILIAGDSGTRSALCKPDKLCITYVMCRNRQDVPHQIYFTEL